MLTMPRKDAGTWMRGGLVLLTATAFAACGGGEQGAAGEGEAGAGAETQAQAGPVVPPDSAATVTGVINFEGSAPAAEPIDMSKEPTCAEAYEGQPMTQHAKVSDGKLADVFVYVKSGLDREFPATPDSVVLDQLNCRYHPHVMGVETGQPIVIKNSDGILHNINAQPRKNRGFNKSQPGAIEYLPPVSFSMEEVMIPVRCDVHGWMNAYIGVTGHPYHATSAQDGSFTLENLPPGEYVIEAWHQRYGTMTDTVTVAAQETAQVSFTYSADMAGRHVPMGEPLVVHHDGTLTRAGKVVSGNDR